MMETWEASGNLLKALQLGDEAYKAMKINIEEVKEVVANAKERMEEQKGIEKIIEAFGTAGDIKEMQDDEELLREYEALVTEEDGTPPQAKKASPGSNGLSPPAKTESMTKAEQEKQPA